MEKVRPVLELLWVTDRHCISPVSERSKQDCMDGDVFVLLRNSPARESRAYVLVTDSGQVRTGQNTVLSIRHLRTIHTPRLPAYLSE